MKRNFSQRQSLRAAFAKLARAVKPKNHAPFGGRAFFPTHAPRRTRPDSFAWVAVVVDSGSGAAEMRRVPVCIHRGTHINRRHNAAYIPPRRKVARKTSPTGGAK